jgi:hypothetical protein
MLIANHRGVGHADQTAPRLARRWSKVAAMLFPVAAVSGTVLRLEPGPMGRFDAAYGIAFATPIGRSRSGAGRYSAGTARAGQPSRDAEPRGFVAERLDKRCGPD